MCGASLAPAVPVREVRKTVTVVFCDVTGSTALGERLDPESLRDVQSRYFDAMREAIERHGGTVEKYIGDAVMAVFGIPRLHEDDAIRAVRAAVDMRDVLVELNKELERDRGVTIAVRIGVNTGEVVAGDPATRRALVTGDAVNVAPRLEERAAPGEILMSEATHRLVRDVVEAYEVDPVVLKGKLRQVQAWRVLRVQDATSAVPRRLDSPMVGRERPLAQLSQAYGAAIEDTSCQLFTILGAAGVGKSRLVDEFLSGVGEGATILRGRCLPYGEGITYFPVVEAIKEASGLADFDLPEVVEAKICSVLDGDEHQGVVCRHVAQLIGVAESAGGDETFWAIRRFFEATARDHPLVLVFDDVHWGEPSFLDLVEHIADWSRGSSILLLCMARSELLDVRATWGGGKLNAATVSLEPLTADQAEVLVTNLLRSAEIPAELASTIVARAEGNPLFVEETLAMLIDDGLVARDGERWRVTGDLSAVEVPPSIHALLAARLERLTQEERTVLEVAAVVGKDFFLGAVRDLMPDQARAQVPADLMGLVRKELIHPQRTTLPGEDAFRFRHLLIRDAAYDAISKARRAEMHEHVAGWLERTAGEAVVEQEEIVGYHLEQACLYRKQLAPSDERSEALGRRAATRLAMAGRRASGRGDFPAAANLLHRALSIGGQDDTERAATLYHLGVTLDEVGDSQEALATFDEAMRLSTGDRSVEWLARIWRSEVQSNLDPHSTSTQECRDELEAAIRSFDELDDETGLATAWTKLAFLEFIPCRYDHANRAAHRAMEHARRSGDDRLFTDALRYLLFSQLFGSSTPEEGRRTLDDLTEDLSRTRSLEATAFAVRGWFQALEGSFDEARRLTATRRRDRGVAGVARDDRGVRDVRRRCGVRSRRPHRRRRSLPAVLRDPRRVGPGGIQVDGRGEPRSRSSARSVGSTKPTDSPRSRETSPPWTTCRRRCSGDRRRRWSSHHAADPTRPSDSRERRSRCSKMPRARKRKATRGWIWLGFCGSPARSGEAEQAAREALGYFERKGNKPSAASTRSFLEELHAGG